MGSIITNGTTSQYEIAAVDITKVLQTYVRRDDAYQLHSVAMNGYIFATYTTLNASQIDVYYFGVSGSL